MGQRPAIGAGLVAVGLAAAGCAGTSVSHTADRQIASCVGDQAAGPRTPVVRPAAMWDFNGDGRADVATKPGNDEEAPGARSFTVLISGTRGTPVCREVVRSSRHESLARLYSADLNGDGRADLIETAPGKAVVIHFGTRGGVSPTSVQVIPSPLNEFRDFGWSVAAADFNADGYDDLAIGAPGETDGPTYSRRSDSIFVYFGGPSGISLSTAYRIRSPNNSSFFFGGTILAADFTGDGYPDLVETHRSGHDDVAPRNRSRTLFLLGSATGPHHPVEVAHQAGFNVVGDVMGSSAADLVMSTTTGWYVLVGHHYGLAKPVLIAHSPSTARRKGHPEVGSLLDVDGDGRLDAVVRDRLRTVAGYKDAGAIEIARGTRDGFDARNPMMVIDAALPHVPGCLRGGLWGGETLTRDLTGDGRPDLLVYASAHDRPGSRGCWATDFVVLTSRQHGFARAAVYAWFPDSRDLVEDY